MRSRALAALCPLAASAAVIGTPAGSPAATSVTVLVVEGKGFGHGVGMAQDGAFWMGKAGATTNAILGHFYPGTNLGRATGTVKVGVHSSGSQDAVLAFPNGGQLRDGQSGPTSNGFPISVVAGWPAARVVRQRPLLRIPTSRRRPAPP